MTVAVFLCVQLVIGAVLSAKFTTYIFPESPEDLFGIAIRSTVFLVGVLAWIEVARILFLR